MEDLFRFFVIRPPSKVDSRRVLILEQSTDFIEELRAALSGEKPAEAVREVARRFVAPGYVDAVKKLRLGNGLIKLEAALRAAGPIEQLTVDEVAQAIIAAFRQPADHIAGSEDFQHDHNAIWEAIIAIKVLRSEHSKPIADLVRALRLLALIERIAHNGPDLEPAGAVAAVLAMPIQLPPDIFPLPRPESAKLPDPERPEDTVEFKRLEAARAEAARLRRASEEFMSLEPGAFVEDALQGPDDTVPRSRPPLAEIPIFRPFTTRRRAAASGTFKPQEAPKRLFTLKAEVAERLSEETRAVVHNLNLDPTQIRMDRVVTKIESELGKTLQMIADLEALTRKRNVARIGSTLLLEPITYFPWFHGHDSGVIGRAPSVPATHGLVQPAGVADLLLVKQQLKCYEAREIAHIENVLKGELKAREHRRATTTEEIIFTEAETITEEERELESAERFELQREAAETIKEDAQLEAGLKISGKYGFAVEFETYVKGATSNSKERSTRHASQYASEVTSRSASKITERFKQQITRRILQQVEETNRHKLNNVNGADHVVGIYQWVEKVYEARVYNYGIRTLYDFMVPEPAAFLIEALKQNLAEGSGLEKPADFILKPNQLTEDNYHLYVREYEATGVEPPPEPFVTLAKTFRAGPDTSESETRGVHVDSAELAIPDGYQAVYGHAVLAGMNYWDSETEWIINFSIGRKRNRFKQATAMGCLSLT